MHANLRLFGIGEHGGSGGGVGGGGEVVEMNVEWLKR